MKVQVEWRDDCAPCIRSLTQSSDMGYGILTSDMGYSLLASLGRLEVWLHRRKEKEGKPCLTLVEDETGGFEGSLIQIEQREERRQRLPFRLLPPLESFHRGLGNEGREQIGKGWRGEVECQGTSKGRSSGNRMVKKCRKRQSEERQ